MACIQGCRGLRGMRVKRSTLWVQKYVLVWPCSACTTDQNQPLLWATPAHGGQWKGIVKFTCFTMNASMMRMAYRSLIFIMYTVGYISLLPWQQKMIKKVANTLPLQSFYQKCDTTQNFSALPQHRYGLIFNEKK